MRLNAADREEYPNFESARARPTRREPLLTGHSSMLNEGRHFLWEAHPLQSMQQIKPMSIEPFTLPYSEAAVEDLRSRLAQTRWPDEIPASGWEYGINLDYMRQLCGYWKDHFDWKTQIEKLSAFHHYRCCMEGYGFTSFTSAARARADPADPDPWLARIFSRNAQDHSVAHRSRESRRRSFGLFRCGSSFTTGLWLFRPANQPAV